MNENKPPQSYEEAYEALKEVIKSLENDNLPLEESIDLYQKGQELSSYCMQLLKDAKQRVEILSDELLNETEED